MKCYTIIYSKDLYFNLQKSAYELPLRGMLSYFNMLFYFLFLDFAKLIEHCCNTSWFLCQEKLAAEKRLLNLHNLICRGMLLRACVRGVLNLRLALEQRKWEQYSIVSSIWDLYMVKMKSKFTVDVFRWVKNMNMTIEINGEIKKKLENQLGFYQT